MKIDELIEKYFEGETSPEEEQLLREMLAEDNSGRYDDVKYMLIGFDDLRKVSSDFKPAAHLHNANTIKHNLSNKNLFNIKLSYYLAAAVIVLVSLLVVNFINSSNSGIIINNSNIARNKDFTKKEIADVFTLVSDKVDYALQKGDAFDDVAKQLNVLDKLNLINKYTDKR